MNLKHYERAESLKRAGATMGRPPAPTWSDYLHENPERDRQEREAREFRDRVDAICSDFSL